MIDRSRSLSDAAGGFAVDDPEGAGERLATCQSTLDELNQWYEVFMACVHDYAEVMGQYPGEAGHMVDVFMAYLDTVEADRALERFLDRKANGTGPA